jgi:hypothetical protein
MAGVNRPVRHYLPDTIKGAEAANQAQATQQGSVVTIPVDPVTGIPVMGGGDPGHQYATFVTGWLGTICGINEYGAASYKTGSWVQL